MGAGGQSSSTSIRMTLVSFAKTSASLPAAVRFVMCKPVFSRRDSCRPHCARYGIVPAEFLVDIHRYMDQVTTIEVTGTLSRDELLRFHYFHSYRRTWWMVIIMMLVCLIALVVALVGLSLGVYGASLKLGAIVLGWLFFCSFCTIALPKRAAKRYLDSNISLRGPVTYTFGEEGIQITSPHSSGENAWTAVWNVYESNSLFCVYYGTVLAHVLPKRFFKNEMEQIQWRALVERQISPKRIVSPGVVGRRC